MSAVSAAVRVEKIPWFSLLVIASIFFYTMHDVRYTRYFAERGSSGYVVTEEEAQQIMTGFEKGQLRNAVAYLALAVFGALSLAIGTQNRFRVKDLLSGAVIFFMCWAFLSIFWAENRASTFNKLAILGLLCVGIAGVLKRFSDRDLVLLVFYGIGAYVAIGLLSEVAMGSFKPWISGYRFSGTCHPNGQALDCGLLLFAAWTLYRSDKRRVYLAVAVAAFVLLVLTKSRTSIAGVLFAPVALWSLGSTRTHKAALAAFAGTAICFLLLIADVAMPALQRGATLGRADTDVHAASLSGRADLWREIVDGYVSQRPVLGYGYNSFWTVEHVNSVSDAVGFIPGNAHSAFLDVLLGLGMFGFAAYVLLNLAATVRAVRCYWNTGDLCYGFFSMLLLFSLFHGLTESTFLFPSMTTFISMLILARLAFQEQPEASPAAAPAGRLQAAASV